MGYGLGIDVGTAFTAAALNRDGNVEMFPLATYQLAVPSVIFAEGAVMLFGGPADRRGAVQPMGLAREFKRRLGDPIPLVLSGSPYHADRLTALMVQWVVESVTAQVGETPTQVVLTHPANWTEYQLGTLRNALADVKLERTVLISEPAAAALDFSTAANVEPGSTLLVYDLGGGTFDVALLRREADTFEHEVEPAGIERLGGIDFDESVFQHVLTTVPPGVLDAARQSLEGAAAIAQLRRRCVEGKEALSSEFTSDIPVMLPGYTASVRITRAEFERMIHPMVRQTIEVLVNVLDRAQMKASALGAVLLVGGSSRIPLVPQMVTEQLGVQVRIDAHPKLVVAKGAARYAGLSNPATRSSRPSHGAHDDDNGSKRWLLLPAALLAAAIAAAGAGYWFIARNNDDGTAATGQSTTATSTVANDEATIPAPTLITSPPTSTESAPSVVVVVPGDELWTNTGVDLSVGDVIDIHATGQVSHNTDPASSVGPEGDPDPVAAQFNRTELGVPLNGPHASLIGRIGAEPPFVIGAQATVKVENDGRLALGVNDQGVGNNAGAFDVTMIVTPVP